MQLEQEAGSVWDCSRDSQIRFLLQSSDFIFSAICEEMGLIFGLCMTLVCVSCYVMFLNIAMQLRNVNSIYNVVALGLGTCYIFQVFLAHWRCDQVHSIHRCDTFRWSATVVVLLLSTVIMFAIIQGLYILREDEEEDH